MNKEQLLELIAELTKENMQLRKQVAQAKYETDIWMDLCCKQRDEEKTAAGIEAQR